MKAILIDNEKESNEVLGQLLKQYCPMVQVVAVCESAYLGIEQIREKKPDLIFLDIEMEGMSGLEMLVQLQPFDFEVIFVTGFNEYAQQAIRLSALDYISKPPLVEDILAAVLRAAQLKEMKGMLKRYEVFFSNMARQQNNQSPGRIALLQSNNSIEYIDLHSILYIQADRAYCIFHLFGGRSIMVAKNMKIYEDLLEGLSFKRTHRSYLVNLNHIRFFHKNKEQIELTDGSRIPVSKSEKEQLLYLLSKPKI